MEATELVLQGAMANQRHKQKPLLFVKHGKYGTTPTKNVQGPGKFEWACLTKHLAYADIPNARLSAKSKLNSNMCLLECIWKNIEKKHRESDSKVQAQIRSC